MKIPVSNTILQIQILPILDSGFPLQIIKFYWN